MTTVYKICKKEDGKLLSCSTKKALELEYIIGQSTTPKIEKSCLFAFKDFTCAHIFLESLLEVGIYEWRIFSAEAETSDLRLFFACHASDEKSIIDYWQGKRNHPSNQATYPLPYGTVLCTSITLLEEV